MMASFTPPRSVSLRLSTSHSQPRLWTLFPYTTLFRSQLSLTKEGMYPEFSLDGIPYKAYRNPGKYRDEICCDAVHPEQLDTGLPSRREKLLRIARDRKSTRLNSSHSDRSRMPSSA